MGVVGMTRLWLRGAFAVGLAFAPAAAHAQMESREAIQLQNEILALRHDLDALQKSGGSGGSALGSAKHASPAASAASSDILTQFLDRVSLLEDQMRQLRGQVDELNNQMARQNADLNKKIDDLGFRVDTLEGGKHPAATAPAAREEATDDKIPPSTSPPPAPLGTLPVPPTTPPAASSPAASPAVGAAKEGAAKPAKPTAESLLQDGRSAFVRHDYASAADAAEQVLALKGGGHAVDAHFLLGESLAAQHQYQKAALAFDDTYKAAPTGPHAPEALLGLADSLTAINAKPAACATLAKFAKEFPAARQGLRDRAQTLRQRAACG
jgi:TolA-binding protein